MGDVGSLALGGAIGTVAVLAKQELLLVLVGGLFVLEALSVIVQVASFKLPGKRVFRMAPLHHHFELAGWAEPKIIVRFWILALLFALLVAVDAEAAMKVPWSDDRMAARAGLRAGAVGARGDAPAARARACAVVAVDARRDVAMGDLEGDR